jgi:hypothetical protein
MFLLAMLLEEHKQVMHLRRLLEQGGGRVLPEEYFRTDGQEGD